RFITISREYGCAGFRIADRLASALNEKITGDEPLWTVYDRKLVEVVCADHKLNRVLVDNLDRQRKFVFGDYFTGMFTGEPSLIKIFKKFAETIFDLAAHGRVIIIGRASCIITGKLTGGLHVRIVAPLEWRVKQVAAHEKIDDLKKARKYVLKNDLERGKFAQDFVAEDTREPAHYDLVLNQEKLGVERTVSILLETMKIKSQEV
ncbi:MAG TPA: cytidylate kinase-like family protein, partial [Candidatus Glassbacteria bacterium]|nr:cytidylate kinase-like family protein [Candidatus Glassbacteria bacterium]